MGLKIAPALPAGLQFNALTGAITGVATVVTTAATYTVTATDANANTSSKTFNLAVNNGLTTTTAIASKVLTQNAPAASFTPVTTAGGAAPVTFSIAPGLPAGLTLNPSTGAITGTPSAVLAATTYTVTATDTNHATASSSFSLSVSGVLSTATAIASKVLTQNFAATNFQPVTYAGGTSPVTLTLGATPALPAGLTFSAGVISGTPTMTLAATTFTVTATDANNATSSSTFSLTVSEILTTATAVANTVLTQGKAATSFTPVTYSGGTSPVTMALGSTPALPAGLTFSTAGLLSGTPSTALATSTFTVIATDANGATSSRSFSLTVNGTLATTVAVASKTLTQNGAATSYTPVTYAGGTSPVTLALGSTPALPTGLTFSTAGLLSGTPSTALATSTFTVTATDANGATSSSRFSLTVNDALTTAVAVASKTLTQNGTAASYTPVTYAGGTSPVTLALGSTPALPAGLTFSTAGLLSGTPSTALATSTFTVTATDANGATATATFNLTVNPTLVAAQAVATKVLTNGQTGVSYTPETATGGTTAYGFALDKTLPAGLTMSPTTGLVTGSPTAASVATVYTVTVTDANGATATATFNLTVNAALVATAAVPTKALTINQASVSYTPVTATGGTTAYGFALDKTLPTGLSMSATTGLITGVPTAVSAATNYTVTVTDANSQTATAIFSLTVNAAFTSTAVAPFGLTQNQSVTPFNPVTGSGGTAPITYVLSASPALPAGVSYTAGQLGGTPTTVTAAADYTVTATDANGAVSVSTFNMKVNIVVSISTTAISPIGVTQNNAVTPFQPVTATGGTDPITYAVSPSLPTGLAMSAAGVISGTPTVITAAANYTVTATDANGASSSKPFNLTVNAAMTTTAVAPLKYKQSQATTSVSGTLLNLL